MISRIETVLKKIYHCPKCRRPILNPLPVNIKITGGGGINLRCGNCATPRFEDEKYTPVYNGQVVLKLSTPKDESNGK